MHRTASRDKDLSASNVIYDKDENSCLITINHPYETICENRLQLRPSPFVPRPVSLLPFWSRSHAERWAGTPWDRGMVHLRCAELAGGMEKVAWAEMTLPLAGLRQREDGIPAVSAVITYHQGSFSTFSLKIK